MILKKIERLQEESTLIFMRMLEADQAEWIELNEKSSAIQREIDVLSCLVDK